MSVSWLLNIEKVHVFACALEVIPKPGRDDWDRNVVYCSLDTAFQECSGKRLEIIFDCFRALGANVNDLGSLPTLDERLIRFPGTCLLMSERMKSGFRYQ